MLPLSVIQWEGRLTGTLGCVLVQSSPALAIRNLWLFLKVKMTLKGEHFEQIMSIKTAVREDFQNCVSKWQEQWDGRVQREQYFEGD